MDYCEMYLGTIQAWNRKAAIKRARTEWPTKTITGVAKVPHTPRYGGQWRIYGRPRFRRGELKALEKKED